MFLTRFDRYEYRLYRRNRRRRQLAAFLAVLLIMIGAGLSHQITGHVSRKHPAHPATSPSARALTRSPRATVKEDIRSPLRWADFHGIALPVSAQDGPRHTSRGLAWGFTRTQRGALLAAVNITVRTAAQWGPAIYRPTIRREVTGPDADALIRSDGTEYAALRAAARVRPGQAAGRGYAVEAAYQFIAYTAASATVDIVTEGPGSTGTTVLAVTRIGLVWQRGDWRVLAPPGGNWANSATTTTSLAGYTAFPDER